MSNDKRAEIVEAMARAAIEAACEKFWVDSWKELHPGTRHKLREMMAKAIAAYERAMWRAVRECS